MTIQLEIKLIKQPQSGQGFAFSAFVDGDALLVVSKTFGAAAADVIAIGADASATAVNIRANLVANDAAAGVTYSVSGSSVFVDVDVEGWVTADVSGTLDYVSVYVHEADAQGMEPFGVKDFFIEVIDTYENDRIEFEEFSQADSLRLSYDGGEDLYSPMMPSKIMFSMAVKDHADGKFLHLLTGDETRFLVRLKNIDDEGVQTLLWQGYILPDLYSEPWKNGVPFIEFTATDMLALLKGKTFKPWFYYQRYNIATLLGYIFEKTGLQQEMWVRPAFVNVSHGEAYRWRDINVSLLPYVKDGKYENLYQILEDVLTAQGLCLYSFRGKWFLEGLTRRGEVSGEAEVYHPDGIFKENTTVVREIRVPLFSNTPPLITAETPWRKVSLNFDTDSGQNLLPEGVVVKDYYATRYLWGHFDMTVGYLTTFMAYWKKVGAAFLQWSGLDKEYLEYWPYSDAFTGANEYDVTEAEALVNYFECNEKPYVTTLRRYEIEIEADVKIGLSTGDDSFEDHLKDGLYDTILLFQVLNNGVEIMSNRPGFADDGVYDFEKESTGKEGPNQTASFKLKREFSVTEDGLLTIRLLAPVGDISDIHVDIFYVFPTVFKINVLGGAEDNESAFAVRDINYTKEIEADVNITCTVDGSVVNSFGVSPRLADQYAQIPVTSVFGPFYDWHFFEPSTYVYLELYRWAISQTFQDLIFRADLQKSLFLKRADGSELHYFSIYSKTVEGVPQMAVYNDYSSDLQGKPVLPKDFVKLPYPDINLPGVDKLMMMLSLFYAEDKNKRALWKMYGFDDETADSYVRTMARAYHSVRPSVCFSIDCQALTLVFPGQLVQFTYLNEDKIFIPVRLDMDLFHGKTQITKKESKLEWLDDITFE